MNCGRYTIYAAWRTKKKTVKIQNLVAWINRYCRAGGENRLGSSYVNQDKTDVQTKKPYRKTNQNI